MRISRIMMPAAFLAVYSLLSNSSAQTSQITQPFLGKVGARQYCSGEFKDNGKAFPGMVEAEQPYVDTVIFRIKDRFNGQYKFPSIQEEFPYVTETRFVLTVNGPAFGDSTGDYAISGMGEPAFGNPDPKQSKITDAHKLLVNDAVACIRKEKK